MVTENKSQQTINELCKKLKNAYHEAQSKLLAKITNEIEQFIREENGNSDSTYDTFEVSSDIAEFVQEHFEKLIDADSDKKNCKTIVENI